MSRQRLNFSLVLGGFFFGILLTYTMVPSFVNHESQHAAKHQTNHGFSKRAVGQDILKFGNPGKQKKMRKLGNKKSFNFSRLLI